MESICLGPKGKGIHIVSNDSKNPSLLRHHGFLILRPKPESNIPHAEQLHYFSGTFCTHGHQQMTDEAKDSFCAAYGTRLVILK